ncbi:G2/M phase-specific E3 ubiquitin-protein ligase-like [Paramacrobiotus metropolitanus]|uniref:G2/M phase-specific E3 ubiquitin-protein ligase-like n=1 Tax=Paramacrobiotus metropolitanus TaxID=2943436 RepID=UPI002445FC4E|nr:G2/M phase-specific E3 ubiquitin-protein ligase-like [Paramacrobiotus metropolitanus]
MPRSLVNVSTTSSHENQPREPSVYVISSDSDDEDGGEYIRNLNRKRRSSTRSDDGDTVSTPAKRPPKRVRGGSRQLAQRNTRGRLLQASTSAQSAEDESSAVQRPQRARKAVVHYCEEANGHDEVPPPAKVKKDNTTKAVTAANPPSATDGALRCILCERTGTDRNLYFRMDSENGLNAHYLCMFTASNLHQTEDPRSKEPGVICGFKTENVRKEYIRSRKLFCIYCKKRGAAVGCSIARCKATYHYPCGVENNCFFSFTGSFESFCPRHIPVQQFPRPKDMSTVNTQCVICLDEPDLKDKVNTLITTCCYRAIHRDCLAGCAVNSGKHHLKCPACNEVNDFRDFCDKVGIHVPNADATWLAEEYAREQAEDEAEAEEVRCAAGDLCRCPNGLAFDEDIQGRDWNIERCHQGCGKLMHAGCMTQVGKTGKNRHNYCKDCYDLELKIAAQLGRSALDKGRREESSSPEIPVTPTRSRRGNRF